MSKCYSTQQTFFTGNISAQLRMCTQPHFQNMFFLKKRYLFILRNNHIGTVVIIFLRNLLKVKIMCDENILDFADVSSNLTFKAFAQIRSCRKQGCFELQMPYTTSTSIWNVSCSVLPVKAKITTSQYNLRGFVIFSTIFTIKVL